MGRDREAQGAKRALGKGGHKENSWQRRSPTET